MSRATASLSTFFDSAELEVHALARAPGGGLYVGTSPDGRIYKVDAAGKSAPFFDPDDKYIWALAVDAKGVVYAATGDKGLIYRITPDGKGEVFYRTKATHVRALFAAPSGAVLAGTESPGRVFRVTADGAGFLLLDSGLQEISALRPGPGGVVYAAALTGRGEERPSSPNVSPEPSRPMPVPSVSTEITSMSVVEPAGPIGSGPAGAARESGRASGKGAVYRIQADGAWDQVWTSAEDAPYDVALDGSGALLVATGQQGQGLSRRRRSRADDTAGARRRHNRSPPSSPTAIAECCWQRPIRPRCFRLSARPAATGSYESEVRDAESLATWGAISWRGTIADGHWGAALHALGQHADGRRHLERVVDGLPQSRRRADHQPEGALPAVEDRVGRCPGPQPGGDLGERRLPARGDLAHAAYLQRNLRPEIATITIHPPGVVFQKPFSTGEAEIAGFDAGAPDRRPGASAAQPGSGSPPLGRRGYQKGLQTFLWKAQDPNDDDLSYDVLYRREGETTWKALKRNLTEPLFVWDTTSVPNGTYVVKIAVSDAPANPRGDALMAERESSTFDIDNSPPTISVLSAIRTNGHTVVRFTVRDVDSAVQRVEYSLDADRWRPIYPKDGIADSRLEEFELTIETDTADKAIILRALDAMNNVATGRAEPVDAPKR